MSNGVATSTDIASALKDHTVSTKVESPNSENVTISTLKMEPCPHCKRVGFSSSAGRAIHVTQCILNPRRTIPQEKECPKCHVGIASRSLRKHIDQCTGSAADTLRQRALREDLLRRKAKATKSGKEFQPTFGGKNRGREVEFDTVNGELRAKVVKTANAPKQKRKYVRRTATRQQETLSNVVVAANNESNLEVMIALMAARFTPAMGSRYREFMEWAQTTEKLWESV